ncbi:MAG: hypothetical protein ABSC03_06940 [Verrucomicrobiota bacterium]|jgi:hypothetical protein
MVTFSNRKTRRRASITAEMVIALGLLAGSLLPISYSFVSEQRLARAAYQRAVAMEIVDGEMEAMVAGEWKAFHAGAQNYTPRAAALKNLPPGSFTLTVGGDRVRLEWQPAGRDQGGRVVREVKVTP